MTNKQRQKLETSKPGFANGVSVQLHEKQKENGEDVSLTVEEKTNIIENAAFYYGEFLRALGVNWEEDPNSKDTPMRVAKAYVNDLWAGRYNALSKITNFPADGYDGIVFEGGIPLTSMCSHHHQTIEGRVHIAYISNDKVVGLSKLNRIVEHFGRRGAIQEQLTVAIHKAVSVATESKNVAVMIEATHNCVSCRGVKHKGSGMVTTKFSGAFDKNPATRNEFLKYAENYKSTC